jgi:hypothetical protein
MLLLGVFAAGIAIGGPAWGALTEDRPDDRGRRGGESSDSRNRERKSYSEHLQEDLNLTVEQRAAVDSILQESQSDMRQVWREMRAEIDTLRQEVANEIMQLLDEEQQAKYREMLERSRRRGERERATREDRNHE